MNRSLKTALGLIIVGLAAAASLLAHHNMSAIFDFNDRVTRTGLLSSFDWRNPHIEFMVEVKGEQGPETWKFEGPSPGFFRLRDTNKADFEKALNKTITVEASRARDGSKWGLLRTATLPDGKLVSACPQNC